MSESTTATRESPDLHVTPVECLPSTDPTPSSRPPVGGLATYYRLRCIALEATVATLESELERQGRRTQEIIARYEDVLQGRDCGDESVFTHP